jgi:hypothetical protein
MKSKYVPSSVVFSIVFALLCGNVVAQDKNSLRVPDGLGFSDFEGYEAWQVVSVSHPSAGEGMSGSGTLNVIVADPAPLSRFVALSVELNS